MKRTTQRSKRILLTVMAIPLLSVFVLTLTCSLGDFVLSCCTEPTTTQADHLTSHHAHDTATQESHSHSSTHEESSEGHHGEDDDDCCNDLTTSFFSVFQVQPHVFIADHPVPIDYTPVIAVKNTFNFYHVDQSLIYPGFETPPKIAPSGWHLRILHQSFLN